MLCEIFVKDRLKIDCWQREFSLKKAASCNLMRWEEIRDKLCYAYTTRDVTSRNGNASCEMEERFVEMWVFFQVCGTENRELELDHRRHVSRPQILPPPLLLLQVHKSAFSHKIYVENKIIFSCENFTPNILWINAEGAKHTQKKNTRTTFPAIALNALRPALRKG